MKSVWIAGQGLAGTLLANELLNQGYAVRVIDPGESDTSTRVAAGMFTPVSGKRMTLTPGINTLYATALEVYHALEQKLGVQLVHPLPVFHAFSSVKEQNDLMSRMDDPDFAAYVNAWPSAEPGVIQPFGAFEVSHSGWLDTTLLCDRFRDLLQSRQLLRAEFLEYDRLVVESNTIRYGDEQADALVFCEGYQFKRNPFFQHLKIISCKGDVLDIAMEQGPQTRVIKKGCYLLPLGNGKYRAGATYLWEEEDTVPSESGRSQLTTKLDEMLEQPYQVTGHRVGIRPTTANRKPFAVQHPEHPRLFALNGLGTKGVLNAPTTARQMAALIHSTVGE